MAKRDTYTTSFQPRPETAHGPFMEVDVPPRSAFSHVELQVEDFTKVQLASNGAHRTTSGMRINSRVHLGKKTACRPELLAVRKTSLRPQRAGKICESNFLHSGLSKSRKADLTGQML